LPDTKPSLLVLPETEIRRHGPGHILAVCWRQWRTERDLARRGVHFRLTDPHQVAKAYAAMSAAQFDAINGRQDWANWRTIPRCISGHVPQRPLRIVDLGCGTGSSTRVLAFYAPLGSQVLGFEIAEPLLAIARARSYLHRSGQAGHVEFSCQAVTEILRESDGTPVPDGTIDVANASGVVGQHLDEHTVGPLVKELDRVLKEDGIAMLDVGPSLSESQLTGIMEAAAFQKLGHWRSCWLDPTGEVVYRRQSSISGAAPA
jgi:SAM-dependent methyltransferase